MSETAVRTWRAGDNEPGDCLRLTDAYGWEWFPWRHDGGGWRSRNQPHSEPSKTWWWLSMYRGPLKEIR